MSEKKTHLTTRKKKRLEIQGALILGGSIRKIAEKLGVTPKTVMNVKKNGFERKKRKNSMKKRVIDKKMAQRLKKVMKCNFFFFFF